MAADETIILQGAQLPVRFEELPEPPERLFLHGCLGRPPYVAIVGTRKPSEEAREFTRQVAAACARSGVTILSGGAVGIDRAAHEGALDAGGTTVVVAPSSYDLPFPAEHRQLFETIVSKGGGHLSAYASAVVARRHQFFLRNSLLAAFCDIMVLVEAPLRSGARNAVASARKLGRPCLIAPAAPWNVRGSGCIAELRLGGQPFSTAKDLLQCLKKRGLHSTRLSPPGESGGEPSDGSLCATQAQVPRGDETLEQAVLRVISGSASTTDDIAESTAQSVAVVSHALLLLQLSGRVKQDSGGRFTLNRG